MLPNRKCFIRKSEAINAITMKMKAPPITLMFILEEGQSGTDCWAGRLAWLQVYGQVLSAVTTISPAEEEGRAVAIE